MQVFGLYKKNGVAIIWCKVPKNVVIGFVRQGESLHLRCVGTYRVFMFLQIGKNDKEHRYPIYEPAKFQKSAARHNA